jgi:hypothetical protein
MLTVIMECRDQEPELAHTLSTLVSGAVEGLVSDVVILDHGSRDGSSHVADAAGCRFHAEWDINDIVQSARGEWLLLLEPGARPQTGWIEDIQEYVALNRVPAKFTPSRNYRRPFLRRLFQKPQPLEYGLLLPKKQAVSLAKSSMALEHFTKGQKLRRLSAEMIPSWVVTEARKGR